MIKLLKTPSQEEVKKHNDLIVRIKIINGDLEKIVENLNKLQKKIDPDEALRYATVEDDHTATIRLDNSFPKGEAVSPDKFYEISMGGSRIPVGEINPKDFQDTVQDKNDSQHTNHDTANVTLIDPKPIV